MKQLFLGFLLMGITLCSYSQNVSQEISPTDTVYSIVQEMPEFTGGDALNYIRKNLSLDSVSQRGCHRIIISFIVDKDGNTTDVKLHHNDGITVRKQSTDNISQMKWKPGKQNGQAVNVKLNIPVYITIK